MKKDILEKVNEEPLLIERRIYLIIISFINLFIIQNY